MPGRTYRIAKWPPEIRSRSSLCWAYSPLSSWRIPRQTQISRTLDQDAGAYAALVARANADLNSGNAAKALDEAQQAEKLDPKPWQAEVVAGAAQELQKTYGAAIESFTQALNDAPEDKKAAINSLLRSASN